MSTGGKYMATGCLLQTTLYLLTLVASQYPPIGICVPHAAPLGWHMACAWANSVSEILKSGVEGYYTPNLHAYARPPPA